MSRRAFAAASFALSSLLGLPSAQAQSSADEARRLFVNGAPPLPACALCHTFKNAGATGQIGPDLDDLRPDADRVEKALRNGIGPMPSFKTLTEAQIKALAAYVAAAAGQP
jgi:cytochrome c6